jgi:plasmid stabilization system protein ParE
MVNRIKKAVGRLRRFPESGSWVPEWDRPDIREIFVGDYRIIYRIKPERVEILTVFQGARRLRGPEPNP